MLWGPPRTAPGPPCMRLAQPRAPLTPNPPSCVWCVCWGGQGAERCRWESERVGRVGRRPQHVPLGLRPEQESGTSQKGGLGGSGRELLQLPNRRNPVCCVCVCLFIHSMYL